MHSNSSRSTTPRGDGKGTVVKGEPHPDRAAMSTTTPPTPQHCSACEVVDARYEFEGIKLCYRCLEAGLENERIDQVLEYYIQHNARELPLNPFRRMPTKPHPESGTNKNPARQDQ